MILFPAIDILDGRAVRLLYGQRNEVTDYGTPLDCAKRWVDEGAQFLHIVDLSGAFDGSSNIDQTIYQISKLGVPIQSGGGLRNLDDIGNRLAAGAARVILGTVCYADPELYQAAVSKYGDRIVAGIDAKNGMLAIKGWTEQVDMTAVVFGKRSKQLGVKYAVYTDISKDGALQGVSLDQTVRMAKETGLNIIASGGISTLDDLYKLQEKQIYGAILGRSLYEGTIRLSEAIQAVQNAL